jgi:CheY-like chemotaxis protein
VNNCATCDAIHFLTFPDFARNPKVSRFDQITVLSEAHNSRWDSMRVFREQTGALLLADQGYDQEAWSRMDGEGCPNGDDEKDDRLRARSKPLYGMGQEPQLPLGVFTAKPPEEGSMIKKLRTGPASVKTILLVDDSAKEKHSRAIRLNTHGYDVDSVSNIEDAYRFSQTKHPDLVLLALSKDSDGELSLWERIKRANPGQQVAFLINNSLYLNPVFSMSDLVRKPGQDDFVERIGALFCAA